MKTINERRQKLLSELIDQSVQIYKLKVTLTALPSDRTFAASPDLDLLRARQRETTRKLHALEEFTSNAWENIGCGG